MTLIMDGKSVAKETEEALKERVEKIKQERGYVPTLATILVGNDPASATYVKMKGNACERDERQRTQRASDKGPALGEH